MFLRVGLAVSALCLMANNDLPPVKFQHNAVPVVLVTVYNTNDDSTCGKAGPGYVTQGCETTVKGAPVITVPNPCTYPEASDEYSYAHLLCHEMGHANGWNAAHDN